MRRGWLLVSGVLAVVIAGGVVSEWQPHEKSHDHWAWWLGARSERASLQPLSPPPPARTESMAKRPGIPPAPSSIQWSEAFPTIPLDSAYMWAKLIPSQWAELERMMRETCSRPWSPWYPPPIRTEEE